MDFECALSGDESGTVLSIRVVPRSHGYNLEYDPWRKELKVKVKAPPVQGKANHDVIVYLAQYFDNPVLISGSTSRSKRVKVDNTIEEVVDILEEIII